MKNMIRKKHLSPAYLSKREAKELMLQLYRDINDRIKSINKVDYADRCKMYEICDYDYERLLGAIEALCVPLWLRSVRNECRKRDLL